MMIVVITYVMHILGSPDPNFLYTRLFRPHLTFLMSHFYYGFEEI